jgi:hypothetical protein
MGNTRREKHIPQPSRRTGVSPAYLIVGAQFIEPVFSGRMNPPPTKNKLIAKKEEINAKRKAK